MRIVFMGTPDIAAACLEALYAARQNGVRLFMDMAENYLHTRYP